METQTITFEEFLKQNWERGFVDYILKCYDDGTRFYVIPDAYNSAGETTPRYQVVGNSLLPLDTAETEA